MTGQVRLPLLIFITLLLAPRDTSAQRSWTPFPAPYRLAADTGRAPSFATFTDAAGRVMGLRPLRHVALPSGHREIRLWTGFGIAIPDVLLRIVETPDTVQGEMVYWWSLPPNSFRDSVYAGFFDDMRRIAGQYGCNGSGASDWMAACRVDYGESEPGWRTIMAQFRGFRVFTLPDPSTLEPEGVRVLDGVSIQVEVLDGSRYRTYTYSNPQAQPWPEAECADSLLSLVNSLHPPR